MTKYNFWALGLTGLGKRVILVKGDIFGGNVDRYWGTIPKLGRPWRKWPKIQEWSC